MIRRNGRLFDVILNGLRGLLVFVRVRVRMLFIVGRARWLRMYDGFRLRLFAMPPGWNCWFDCVTTRLNAMAVL